jgi:hypothetical protein
MSEAQRGGAHGRTGDAPLEFGDDGVRAGRVGVVVDRERAAIRRERERRRLSDAAAAVRQRPRAPVRSQRRTSRR